MYLISGCCAYVRLCSCNAMVSLFFCFLLFFFTCQDTFYVALLAVSVRFSILMIRVNIYKYKAWLSLVLMKPSLLLQNLKFDCKWVSYF